MRERRCGGTCAGLDRHRTACAGNRRKSCRRHVRSRTCAVRQTQIPSPECGDGVWQGPTLHSAGYPLPDEALSARRVARRGPELDQTEGVAWIPDGTKVPDPDWCGVPEGGTDGSGVAM